MGSHSSVQSFLDDCTVFSRILFNSLLDTSTCPLVCGWYGVATLCHTPYFFIKFSNSLLQKWEPTSLMMVLGVPNLLKIFFLMNFTTSRASFVCVTIASTPFKT